jgi:hypothetical protein
MIRVNSVKHWQLARLRLKEVRRAREQLEPRKSIYYASPAVTVKFGTVAAAATAALRHSAGVSVASFKSAELECAR